MEKSALPEKMQQFYDLAKAKFTDEAFAVWYSNALHYGKKGFEPAELPADKLRVVPSVKEAAAAAREAVSGMSASSNTRKAVEALADAIEAQ